jgi:hypothetical protein
MKNRAAPHHFTSATRIAGVRVKHLVFAFALTVIPLATAHAQYGGGFGNRVGGVSIDAAGVVDAPEKAARIPMRDALRKRHSAAPTALHQQAELRMISLRRLEEAMHGAPRTKEGLLPDELLFLAGIQRLQYVFVYPEEHDIVLAGPGEGWKVDEEGNIVGVTTGQPVLRLEDLIVAFRTVENAARGGISCSIDPTPEGRQRLDALISRSGKAPPLAMMKRALGPQQITLTGVPADSRFARILVSSDFHMKRMGMNAEPSHVKGMPSYLEMLRHGSGEVPTPRWWLECSYEPIGRSDDGLAFELRGRGVKCKAEDDVVDAQGRVSGTGAVSPLAQKWADLMTEHYEELAAKEASYGELRNIMDMCVVAALIARNQLLLKADCELPTLFSPASELAPPSYPAPKTVDSICTSVKGDGVLTIATGGVLINSWQIADRTEVRPAVQGLHAKARQPADVASMWWNAGR